MIEKGTKIRDSRGRYVKGFKHSLEWKKLISKKLKGKIVSSETKKKMSEVAKQQYVNGRPPARGMLGKHHSEEFKRKNAILKKGNKYLLGYKFSEKSKRKMSLSHKGRPSPLKGRYNLKMRGENHPNWKNGITPINVKIRTSLEYCVWREKILKRDNYTCQTCFKRGGQLNVDHFPIDFYILKEIYQIKSLEQALSCRELWDINNGRTLCIPCHKKTDNFGYRGKKFLQERLEIYKTL